MSGASDPTRTLGVVECFTAVMRQCPNGSARALAEGALAAIEREGSRVLAEQAVLVLSAVSGWRGERASQVKRSLRAFLAASDG